MNEYLNRLLKLTPGIVRRRTGIIREQIDFVDWTKMLTMHDHDADVHAGGWARVCKGTYKGDVGYVAISETWGVRLLLVPRLPPPRPAGSSLKRKRSAAVPEPALFEPDAMERIYGTPAIASDDGTHRFGGNIFEDGLIIQEFDLHSVSSTSVIPTSLFFLFQQSRHSVLLTAKFPRPLEWNFVEGESVLVSSSGKLGVVKTIWTDSVEVDLANGEGIMSVTWSDLRKHIVTGDFVEIVSGPLREQTGWVEGIDGETVHVIDHISAEEWEDAAQFSHIKVNYTPVSATRAKLACRNFKYILIG
jgi:transcription elongation factor